MRELGQFSHDHEQNYLPSYLIVEVFEMAFSLTFWSSYVTK